MRSRTLTGLLIRKHLAILVIISSIALWTLPAEPIGARDQEPQVLRLINASEASAMILGAKAGDHLSGNGAGADFTTVNRAHAIASGDLNHDGTLDVITGAPDADVDFTSGMTTTTINDTGAVHVLLGGSGLLGPIDSSTATVRITGPAALTGSAAPANFGFAVSAGDVNGDGNDDLIIGSPGADFPGGASVAQRNDTGAVYVFFGGATFGSVANPPATAADVVIYGVASGDLFGASTAAGNVGGLSTASLADRAVKDILAGAPGNDAPTRTDSGAAYVTFGGSTLNRVGGQPTVIDLNATPANVVFTGKSGDLLGVSVAVGDINGAGVADVIAGAPLADRPVLASPSVAAAADTGAVFGLFGGDNLTPTVGTSKTFDVNATQQNLSIYGDVTGDRMAASVDAGDVTGDGIPDVLVGAPNAGNAPSGPRVGAGEVYVFTGGSGLNPSSGSERRLDVALNAATLRVFGGNPGDHAGVTVKAGSFNTTGNSDSIPDLLIGLPGFDSRRGAVSVIFGGPNLLLLPTRDLLLAQDDVRVIGQQNGSLAGKTLKIRETLTTSDTTVQPTLEILAASLVPTGGDFPITEDTDVQFTTGSDLNGVVVRGTGAAARLELANNRVLQFDGTNDFVQAANSALLRPASGSWTVEFWLARPGAGAGDLEPIISSRPFTGQTALGWTVAVDSATGKIALVMGDGAKGFVALSTSTAGSGFDHWAVVFDRAGSAVRFLKNGVLDGTVSIAPADLPGAIGQTDAILMGTDSAVSGARFLNGILDDLRVWNQARSDSLIANNFKKEVAGNEAGLVAYWKFSETSGATAIDSTAVGNTQGAAGTINGPTRTTAANRFLTSGRRISPAYNFPSGQLVSSQLGWTLTVPTGATLTVETSLDNGATWNVATSGQQIPVLSTGDELGSAIGAFDLDGDRGGDLVCGAPFAPPSSAQGPRTGGGIVYIFRSTSPPPINGPPVVTITAPNGGETLQSGSNSNITWNASDPDGNDTIANFELRLSTDAGTTFNTIIAASVGGSARQFQWAVPTGINTTQARIRIVATDNQGAKGQDDSNANFTITDVGVSVTLLQPNGGERLTPGQQFVIGWDVPVPLRSQVRGFDLFLSTDGGSTFPQKIAIGGDPAQPALGPGIFNFTWAVPAVCSRLVRVSVVATSNTGVRTSDASNGNLSILDPGPTVNPDGMAIFADVERIKLGAFQPPSGNLIPFNENTIVEVANASGQFFGFSKPPKVKQEGRKLLTKGTINDQSVLVFFPDGATRVIRVTNPPCGVVELTVRRSGEQLILVTAGSELEAQRVWQ